MERTIARGPAEEIDGTCLRQPRAGEIDVGLRQIHVIEGQALQLATIGPIGQWLNGVPERIGARTGEDARAVHERTEDVSEAHHTITGAPCDLIEQWFQVRAQGVCSNHVGFGVDLPEHAQIQDPSHRPSPICGMHHLRGEDVLRRWERGPIRGSILTRGDGSHLSRLRRPN